MTKIKKIPKFKTTEAEARFWDTHDVTDYLSQMKKANVVFDHLAPKEEILTLRIQSVLKRKLEKIAQGYGLNLSNLLRVWLVNKIKETESPKYTG